MNRNMHTNRARRATGPESFFNDVKSASHCETLKELTVNGFEIRELQLGPRVVVTINNQPVQAQYSFADVVRVIRNSGERSEYQHRDAIEDEKPPIEQKNGPRFNP